MSRRQLLVGGGCLALVAAAGVGGIDHFEHPLVERGLHRVGLASSPDLLLPDSGALLRSGILRSRFMHRSVGWTVSRPPGSGALDGMIFCLHGYHSNHRFAFDYVHVPDAAASVGLRVAIAGATGPTPWPCSSRNSCPWSGGWSVTCPRH